MSRYIMTLHFRHQQTHTQTKRSQPAVDNSWVKELLDLSQHGELNLASHIEPFVKSVHSYRRMRIQLFSWLSERFK
eukprot:124382-Amorphochlora_amoeboformis.AAC.1